MKAIINEVYNKLVHLVQNGSSFFFIIIFNIGGQIAVFLSSGFVF